jgi:hypothetical protein
VELVQDLLLLRNTGNQLPVPPAGLYQGCSRFLIAAITSIKTMAWIDDLDQLDTKQFLLSMLVSWLLWFHVINWQAFWEVNVEILRF